MLFVNVPCALLWRVNIIEQIQRTSKQFNFRVAPAVELDGVLAKCARFELFDEGRVAVQVVLAVEHGLEDLATAVFGGLFSNLQNCQLNDRLLFEVANAEHVVVDHDCILRLLVPRVILRVIMECASLFLRWLSKWRPVR